MRSEFDHVKQTHEFAAGTPPPVIHSEPNSLYEEISFRLEHYNTQIEKLNAELKKFTLMRNVLADARDAFDRDASNDGSKQTPPY